MKLLNKCPVCGDKLELDILYQFSEVHTLTRSGTCSRGFRKESPAPVGYTIRCVNGDFAADCELNIVEPRTLKISIIQSEDKYYFEEKQY